jgi:hypothetical protein
MKKTVGIALITLGLSSCTTTSQLTYDKPSDYYHETEGIHQNLTEEEYYELVAQEYEANNK